ncbi:MAG: adenylate/guanylate cyclase domain-containing protein [Longimicrobiales bacterium]
MSGPTEARDATSAADWRNFVPRVVAENLEAGAKHFHKREKPVAVLFADIAGCTRLCEALPPEVMNALTETYFARFFDAVQDLGGTINEIMGDGFMAIFQMDEVSSSAANAACAALGVREATATPPDAFRHLRTEVHVGIHAGRAHVGYTRFRARGWERWTYTASGPVTNVAARLCNHADPGQILVSSDLTRMLGGSFEFEFVGDLVLKNVSSTVRAYNLVSGRVEA